jgi:two-component system, cell cycle sensor histidine kinase and response regulator CckA
MEVMGVQDPEREGYYRALIEHSADAIALLDRDGTLRFVTGAIERISGFTPEDLIGTHPFERVHPNDLPNVKKALEGCILEPGSRVSIEYRALRRDGSWQHQEAIGVNRLDDPAIRAIVVNYRDLSDRTRTGEALVESERALALTFDRAPIGIAHTSLEGRWLRVNRRLCELLGYTPAELLSTSFMAITHEDDVEQDTRALTRLIAGDIATYEREKRYRHKDGHFVSAKLTAVLQRDADGTPRYFISTVEDVTDRVRLEGQLRQGQKMEAVGRLAGGIAHDFNNLLTVIIGYSDLALQQIAPGAPERGDVEEIRHAGKSAAALTQQLLAFSRKQILQPQIVDLNAIVTRMSALLRRLIGEDVELRTRLAAPLDRVWVDAGQIEQIIMNLALNARDAMPQGGSLTVETANVELDARWVALHSEASEGRHVMLAVSDTGIGMDHDVQAHLFEPFFTTKERGNGTGLGLATVYGIVKQSGGSIFVYSEPDHGTTFKIFLPRTEQSADPADAPPPAPPVPVGTETILLVEDSAEVRLVTRTMLARHGYTVLEAAGGADALSLLETYGGPVHLLLTDVVMPGMTGRDLAERLVATRPDLRVLFTSGYTDDTIVRRGILDAGMAFLPKPYTPDVLLQRVRGLLEG